MVSLQTIVTCTLYPLLISTATEFEMTSFFTLHSFVSAVYSLASAVMATHFKPLVEAFSAVPLPMLTGDSQTGT